MSPDDRVLGVPQKKLPGLVEEDRLDSLLAERPVHVVVKDGHETHFGGEIEQPVEGHVAMVENMLADPAFKNLYFDISWDEVAKYAVSSPDAIRRTAAMLNKYPDRFLFGTDTVAPKDTKSYYAVYDMWKPVFDRLDKEAKAKILRGNYERIFDDARKNVRAWERTHVTPHGTSAAENQPNARGAR